MQKPVQRTKPVFTWKRADRRTAFSMIAPAMLVLLAVNVYPFLYTIYISAHTFTLGRPTPPRYIGASKATPKNS